MAENTAMSEPEAFAVRLKVMVRGEYFKWEVVRPNRRLWAKRQMRDVIWTRRMIRTLYGVNEIIAAKAADWKAEMKFRQSASRE